MSSTIHHISKENIWKDMKNKMTKSGCESFYGRLIQMVSNSEQATFLMWEIIWFFNDNSWQNKIHCRSFISTRLCRSAQRANGICNISTVWNMCTGCEHINTGSVGSKSLLVCSWVEQKLWESHVKVQHVGIISRLHNNVWFSSSPAAQWGKYSNQPLSSPLKI